MQHEETLMHVISNCLKSSAAAGVVAFGLCFAATSANAEAKAAGPSWNASTFAAACKNSNRCLGGAGPGGSFYGTIENDGTTTHVTCTSTRCVYDTKSDSGGSPARVAVPDKTRGTGVGLGGLLAGGARPARTPKLDAGQDVPRQIKGQVGKIDTPKVDVPRQIKVEVPKVSAPAGNLKDTKVNVLR
jgi:hypothetical protein